MSAKPKYMYVCSCIVTVTQEVSNKCLDLKGLAFLVVTITEKLEVKRGPREISAKSNGQQQLTFNGRPQNLCTK